MISTDPSFIGRICQWTHSALGWRRVEGNDKLSKYVGADDQTMEEHMIKMARIENTASRSSNIPWLLG
jgi:hypothetical protein